MKQNASNVVSFLVRRRYSQYLLTLFLEVNCGNPGVPTHGEVLHPRAPTYDYMSDLVFSCDRKYTLVGSSTITCQDTGEWSAPIPNCEGKYYNQVFFDF